MQIRQTLKHHVGKQQGVAQIEKRVKVTRVLVLSAYQGPILGTRSSSREVRITVPDFLSVVYFCGTLPTKQVGEKVGT